MRIRPRSRSTVAFIILAAILAVSPFVPASAPQVEAQSPAALGPSIAPSVTPVSLDQDLRDLPQVSPPLKSWLHSALRSNSRSQYGRTAQSAADPVLQSFISPLAMPSPIANFPGVDYANWGSGFPPDPTGAVGPNHYIQTVNTSFAVFAKSGALLTATTYNAFFTDNSTPCGNQNRGDPIVMYDQLADRWIVSDMAWNPGMGPFYECIGVSKSGDPVTGGWWQYALQTDVSNFGDYPKLAVWPDAYYLSANMFTLAYFQSSVRVWALDRQAMIAGQPLRSVMFTVPCFPQCYNTLLPAHWSGDSPPAATPEFFASIDMPNILHLWKFHVDWNVLANSTFTGPTNLAVAPFIMPCDSANIFACVPALNGERVDGLGDRLMQPLQYRYRLTAGIESLWATHTVAASGGVGSPTGIRWYEIRNPSNSPFVYQQGTFQPDSNYRWMPSLATDRLGNMAIGYSVSSPSMFPAIRISGRLITDPLNTLGQGEATLMQGTGSQIGGANRWGDYSSMMIDPADGCTFWYTNEYYANSGWNWQTRIASFAYPSCAPQPPLPTPTSTAIPTREPITPTPRPPRCEDSYEPDNSPWLAHTITGPELHNFAVPGDMDWVSFSASSNWVYWIKAEPDTNMPTAPRIELYADGVVVASNDHAFLNNAELWWWNNGPDRSIAVRVAEVNTQGACGNSQYTLSVRGYRNKP